MTLKQRGEIWVGEDMKDEVLPFLVPTEQLGHRAASLWTKIYFLQSSPYMGEHAICAVTVENIKAMSFYVFKKGFGVR